VTSISGLRVALGCDAAVPVVHPPRATDDESVRQAVRGANLLPPADVHASSEYRAHLAEVLAVRAARQAVEGTA
jgi:carbon-monoxide dehydrogenase medium subunit